MSVALYYDRPRQLELHAEVTDVFEIIDLHFTRATFVTATLHASDDHLYFASSWKE